MRETGREMLMVIKETKHSSLLTNPLDFKIYINKDNRNGKFAKTKLIRVWCSKFSIFTSIIADRKYKSSIITNKKYKA